LAEEGVAATAGVGSSTSAATPSTQVRAEPSPALLLRDSDSWPTGEHVAYVPAGPIDRPPSVRRALLWVVAVVLILGVALLAYLVSQDGHGPFPSSAATTRSGGGPSTSSGQTSAGASPGTPIPIAAVHDFDPVQDRGNGTENPQLAPLAADGNPATSWETLQYYNNPRLGLLKPGVGLVVDLGKVHAVGEVKVGLGGDGTAVELRAAPAAVTAPPAGSADAYRLLDTDARAGGSADFRLDSPVRTRYLLVWLTSLPSDGGASYRGKISEIRVFG
jgi:putative peptidoglycan lipid II flippase